MRVVKCLRLRGLFTVLLLLSVTIWANKNVVWYSNYVLFYSKLYLLFAEMPCVYGVSLNPWWKTEYSCSNGEIYNPKPRETRNLEETGKLQLWEKLFRVFHQVFKSSWNTWVGIQRGFLSFDGSKIINK